MRDALAFEVVRTFHTVLKARAFVEATEAAAQAFESNLVIAKRRFDAGTLLRADVLDVEVRLAQAREDLVRARNALALSERTLRNLIGLEDAEFVVAGEAPPVSVPTASDDRSAPGSGGAPSSAKRRGGRSSRGRGGYYPKLSAFGSLDYDRGWRMNGQGESWTAGALLEWSLWDGRLTRAKVAEAEAGLDSAMEQERKLRLAVDLEVERAQLGVKDASERLQVTEKAIAQAAESVELARARFAQGLTLATQLLDAETTLTGARVRRAEAEADLRIAVAALRRALALPQLETESASH